MQEMKKYFKLLIFFLMFSQILQSQFKKQYTPQFERERTEFLCGSNLSAPITGYMPSKTPEDGQYLRILIIYVRFPDDNLVGNQMNGAAVWWDNNWDKPRNPYTSDNKFIDSAEQSSSLPFMDRYREYTISDYFCEMSRGEFDVIGDEYSVTLPLSSTAYRELGYSCSELNAIALRIADSVYNIDFSRYNNWTLELNNWVWTPGAGDKAADMIVMEYRRAPGYPDEELWFIRAGIPASGLSDLALLSRLTFDSTGVFSGSGVTCLSLMQNYSKMTQIIEHEMCHRYFFYHVNIGLMTGAEHCSFSMSPIERGILDYITPTDLYFPGQSEFGIFTLRDFVSTGDALVVHFESQPDKYIFVNHQKKSVYDGLSRGGKECWQINGAQGDPYCGTGKGLYIYHEMPPDFCNNFKEVVLLQADGRHNWYVDRWVPYFIPGFTFEIPLFESSSGSITGKSEYHEQIDSVLFSQQEVTDNPCSDKNNDYFVTLDWLGDGLDAFNPGYNEIFGTFSNPATITCDGSLTDMTVHVMSRDSVTGAITIKIYYNKELALSELPPSKPMNLKAGKLILDSLTGKFHPRLRWDLNSEPDIVGSLGPPGSYNIYRGIDMICNADIDPEYTLINTVSGLTNEYVDDSVTLFPYGGGQVMCKGLFRSVSYKIEAVDNTNKASVRSARSIINGYTEHCDDSVLVIVNNNETPLVFSIYNYPNPFNPSTQIKYSLPKNSFVILKVYNLLGEEVANIVNNELRTAGRYSTEFSGLNLASGVYLYVIEAKSIDGLNEFRESKKMVLIK
jgi:hypothetical protein